MSANHDRIYLALMSLWTDVNNEVERGIEVATEAVTTTKAINQQKQAKSSSTVDIAIQSSQKSNGKASDELLTPSRPQYRIILRSSEQSAIQAVNSQEFQLIVEESLKSIVDFHSVTKTSLPPHIPMKIDDVDVVIVLISEKALKVARNQESPENLVIEGIIERFPSPTMNNWIERREMTPDEAIRMSEYRDIQSIICVSDAVMQHSVLREKIEVLQGMKTSAKSIEVVATSYILKAYKHQVCLADVTIFSCKTELINENLQSVLYEDFREFYNAFTWEKPLLITALDKILDDYKHKRCDVDDLKLICGLITRAAKVCKAMKRYSFNSIVNRCIRSSTSSDGSDKLNEHSDLDVFTAACQRVFRASLDYIEDLKLQALLSTYSEPVRLYCHCMCPEPNSKSLTPWQHKYIHVMDNLDIHGLPTILALIEVLLGVKMNRMPVWDDEYSTMGMLDVLSAGDLMEELCSEYLWNPKNIGRVYESIPELSRLLKDNEGKLTALVNKHSIATSQPKPQLFNHVPPCQFIWKQAKTTQDLINHSLDIDRVILSKLFTALTTGVCGPEDRIIQDMNLIMNHINKSNDIDTDSQETQDIRHLVWDLEVIERVSETQLPVEHDDQLGFRHDIARLLFNACGITKSE